MVSGEHTRAAASAGAAPDAASAAINAGMPAILLRLMSKDLTRIRA
jgi:hypothetical protein